MPTGYFHFPLEVAEWLALVPCTSFALPFATAHVVAAPPPVAQIGELDVIVSVSPLRSPVVMPTLKTIDVATCALLASFVVAALAHVSAVPEATVHPLCPTPIATISVSETALKDTVLPLTPFAAMLFVHVIVVVPVGKPLAPATMTKSLREVALALSTSLATPPFAAAHAVAAPPPVAQIAALDVIVSDSPLANAVVTPTLKTMEVATWPLFASLVVAPLGHDKLVPLIGTGFLQMVTCME
jgi:hypothetical protein